MKFKFSVILLCLFSCQFLYAQQVNNLMPLLNHRPVVNKDTLLVNFKGKNNIKLSNYSDIDGDKLTLGDIGKTSFGDIRRAKGKVTYEAYKFEPYSLVDSFVYEICDEYELCSINHTYLQISGVEKEIQKVEAKRIALELEQQRKAEIAALRATQIEEANRLEAQQESERQELRDKIAKARADVNAAIREENALKATKKRESSGEAIDPILPPPPPLDASVGEEQDKTKNAVAKAIEKERKKRKKRKKSNKYATSLNEPKLSDCSIELNDFNSKGYRRISLKNRFFFEHTIESLNDSFTDSPKKKYLSCFGSLASINDITKLTIEFEVQSSYAKSNFGSIQSGIQIVIQLIDGETLSLTSEQFSKGEIDTITKNTKYSTTYILSRKDEKKLRQTEVSGVRVYWEYKYEEYDVNELDFLIDQFKCLDIIEEYGVSPILLEENTANKLPEIPAEVVDTEKNDDVSNSVESNDSTSNISNELKFPNIYFDLDKYYLKREFYSQLHDAANVMLRYPDIQLVVTGHTDARLPNQYNDVLSYKRAEKVISYLTNNYGIDRSRLILQYGDEVNPILTDFIDDYAGKNPAEIGQYSKRRVEIRVVRDESEMGRPAYDGDWDSVGLDTPSIGCSLGDCQYGYGEYHYAQNRRYEGEWSNGKFEGEGTFNYETGEKYVGTWLANKRDGEGQFYDKKGKLVYDGNWKDDVQYGYGIYHYQNGTRYAGQWINGEREGKGRFTIPGTGYYEGEFSLDRFNGEGTFYYSDRSTYVGGWLDNRKHGKGIEYDPDGKIYRQGIWKNGEFVE